MGRAKGLGQGSAASRGRRPLSKSGHVRLDPETRRHATSIYKLWQTRKEDKAPLGKASAHAMQLLLGRLPYGADVSYAFLNDFSSGLLKIDLQEGTPARPTFNKSLLTFLRYEECLSDVLTDSDKQVIRAALQEALELAEPHVHKEGLVTPKDIELIQSALSSDDIFATPAIDDFSANNENHPVFAQLDKTLAAVPA